MDSLALFNLLSYGKELGLINIDLDNYNNLIESGQSLSFRLNNGNSLYLDFSDFNSLTNEKIIKKLRKLMPVCTIIDLVSEAIMLGVITDISSDYNEKPLLDFEKNYKEIVEANCFYYKINSQLFDDAVYKITFDKKKNDIKKKIEYASRTSLFVDTLMKRIMAKYNILLVRRASWSDTYIPKLKLNSNTECISSETSDSVSSTDLIENQLKVLINYRDNFNNTTCSENVIDDIFLNLDGNQINYGFIEIGKDDTNDPIYDVINENVDADDIDSLLKIRNLINEPLVKFNIFEALRNNKDTNLSSLIDLRIKEYDNRLNQDPKIEFTITPLSIYCNHIVKKTATFTVRSTNKYYNDFEYDYNVEFNPAKPEDTEYNIYGDGDIDKLREDEDLILAFSDSYENKDLKMKVTSIRFASCLYDINPKYHLEEYKDVYFLNEALVKLENNQIMPFDGIVDSNTFLKTQIVRGEISGKYVYIKDATKVLDDDILGVDLLELDKERYVSNEYVRKCDICGHIYGAKDDIWSDFKKAHLIVNDKLNRSCCNSCQGTILDDGMAILYSSSYKEYYLDNPNDIENTKVCTCCDNPEKSFIYVSNTNSKDRMCKVCKKYYCSKHMDLENHVCINCNQEIQKRDTLSNPKFVKLIKSNLEPIDAISKELSFNYNKEDNSIWVYSRRKNKKVTYYMVCDDEEKFVHLFGKYVKRGEE